MENPKKSDLELDQYLAPVVDGSLQGPQLMITNVCDSGCAPVRPTQPSTAE
jgi:hypothetical protein